MKSPTTLLIALLLCGALDAQRLHNDRFQDFETVPCPYDSTASITRPVGWIVYQTLDGNWDGPVDSSRCISGFKAASPQAGCNIPLDQIDLARPVFIRADLDAYPPDWMFQPDALYNAFFCSNIMPYDVDWTSGTNCAQGLCSGLFIGIAVPDTNGVPGGNTRLHTGVADLTGNWPSFCNGTSTCFPTERFQEQSLAFLVAKYTFPDTLDAQGISLRVYSADIFPADDFGTFTEVEAYPFHLQNGVYVVPVSDASGNFGPAHLALYNSPGYPSAANPSYVEAAPVPNTTQQKVVILRVGTYETLEVQPFTYFRGAFVAGSDSVRHQFVLMNDGGDFCVNFIDLVFDEGTEFRHRSGQVTMNNPFSCMQFREGSALRVAENGALHYGNGGVGMLALCADARVVLEPGSALVVDAVVNIAECDDNRPPEPFMDVELHPGAQLRFTENARITNQFSQGQAMKLRVWMLGGTLDDSRLPPEQQALIVRAWPEPATHLADNATLLGNDGSGAQLVLRYLSDGTETLDIKWYDTQGRFVAVQREIVQKGYNDIRLTGVPEAGFYLLSVENGAEKAVFKVAKSN